MLRLCLSVLLLATAAVRGQTLTVAAAVSLKESITAVGDDFKKSTGIPVVFAFGGSGQLLAQIRSGAPIDAFISAAPEQMDELVAQGLIVESTRRNVVTNSLVLIAPPKSTLGSFAELNDPKIKRLAIGQPKTVPAGMYAEQTLRSLKLYDDLQARILYGSNVRQVLDYVQTGNADAGLVYATDAAQAGQSVRIVATADPASHQPIVYPAVVLKRSSHAEAAAGFIEYLTTPEATQEFTSRGFGVPGDARPATRP